MYLNTLEKNEMYKSVSEIVGTDIEVVKKFIKENADNIVDCNYDENGIEQLNIDELIQGKTLNQIDSLIVNHILIKISNFLTAPCACGVPAPARRRTPKIRTISF